MNTTFEQIIPGVLDREGKYVNNPNDPGGPTNMGITLKDMRRLNMDLDGDGDVDIDDVSSLTREEAIQYYDNQFWIPSNAEQLPPQLREIYFDGCILYGFGGSTRILQLAVNDKAGKQLLKVDGALGPHTISELQNINPGLNRVRCWRLFRTNKLIFQNPKLSVFAFGWYNRTMEV